MAEVNEALARGFGGVAVGESDNADAKKSFAAAPHRLHSDGEFLLAQVGAHFFGAALVAERANLNHKGGGRGRVRVRGFFS